MSQWKNYIVVVLDGRTFVGVTQVRVRAKEHAPKAACRKLGIINKRYTESTLILHTDISYPPYAVVGFHVKEV